MVGLWLLVCQGWGPPLVVLGGLVGFGWFG